MWDIFAILSLFKLDGLPPESKPTILNPPAIHQEIKGIAGKDGKYRELMLYKFYCYASHVFMAK
jgi:hypothetical protein